MVKRYLINYDERGEQEHPSGDFVHYEDYLNAINGNRYAQLEEIARDKIKELEAKIEEFYKNLPTVVVTLVQDKKTGGLILVKRASNDGLGKWALPGGYQENGEIWQQTAIREVLEETGHVITQVTLADMITVKECNLVFCFSEPVDFDPNAKHDEEISMIGLFTDCPKSDLIAYPTHSDILVRYFNQLNGVYS